MISNRHLFLQNMAQTSDSPLMLEVARAEGVHLYDPDGKAYIDLIAGISVSNVGHCHPKVVAAVQQQAATYMHTLVYGEFVLSPQTGLADYLAGLLPENLQCTYFVNSGSEATEGALKVAKRFTGRPGIVSCHHAYHGSTQGALSIMGDEYFRRRFRPLIPGNHLIRYNELEDLAFITENTAAVVMEVVQAEAGVILPEDGYLEAVRKRCTETGTLLIFDEIQTGCGRTGTMFAFEQYGVIPDILLLAKGLGGGMPIGAFITSREIMSVIKDNPILGHITTFGGHPVCCAAALACLKVIDGEDLPGRAAQKAALFLELLEDHPAVEKIHSKGLMIALYLKDFDQVQQVIRHCMEVGLITDWFLFANRCIRIAPPLTIEVHEIKLACAILRSAMDTLRS